MIQLCRIELFKVVDMKKNHLMKLAELALKYSYAYGDKWYSSAKQLEQSLQNMGVNNIKLYHEYKMPGGLSQSEYMKRMSLHDFYKNFDIFYFDDNFRADLHNAVPDTIEREKIIDDIKQKKEEYKEKIQQEYKELIKLNPELSKISGDPDSVMWGAIFGFCPDDIEYFNYGRFSDKDWSAKQQDILKSFEKYGLKVGYIVSPKTFNKIISELKHRKVNNASNDDARGLD